MNANRGGGRRRGDGSLEGRAMKNGGRHSRLRPSLLLLRTESRKSPAFHSIPGMVSVATVDIHPPASIARCSGHCGFNGTCGDRRSRLDARYSGTRRLGGTEQSVLCRGGVRHELLQGPCRFSPPPFLRRARVPHPQETAALPSVDNPCRASWLGLGLRERKKEEFAGLLASFSRISRRVAPSWGGAETKVTHRGAVAVAPVLRDKR